MKSLQTACWTVALLAMWVTSATTVWQQSQYVVPQWLQKIGGDFTLLSADGPVSLSDFRGKKVLIYFGYTHCPNACPVAMSVIATVLKARKQHDTVGIFISLDPRRDTPVLLQQYTAFFHPAILGLTGSAASLQQVADRWRIAYHVPQVAANDTYTVDHSTFIYLINPQGKVVALFDEKTSSKEIQQRLRSH